MRFAVPAQIIVAVLGFIFVGNGQILLGGTEMLRYLENVVTLQLILKPVNGCGMCVNVCPHGVFGIQDRKAAIIDKEVCMECGACAFKLSGECNQSTNPVFGCATAIIMEPSAKRAMLRKLRGSPQRILLLKAVHAARRIVLNEAKPRQARNILYSIMKSGRQ